jgi:hypothetical protein
MESLLPFLCGSFIRNSMPVYPGAFPDTFACATTLTPLFALCSLAH